MIKNTYSRIENVVGQRFGNLTVLSFAGVNAQQKRKLYVCKCDCGTEKTLRSDVFTRGKVKSCGCLLERRGTASPQFEGVGELSLRYFNKLKLEAVSRNLPFEISLEFLWQLFQKQSGRCALSGQSIHIEASKASRIEHTASVDRIDSSRGYTVDNVQWVHKDINFMKQAFSQERFIRLCSLVTGWSTR